MQIRAKKSVQCSRFTGRVFLSSTDLVSMPKIDADKCYSVRFDFQDVRFGGQQFLSSGLVGIHDDERRAENWCANGGDSIGE